MNTHLKRAPRLGVKASALVASCMLVGMLAGCASTDNVPQESVEQALLSAADGGEFASSDYVEESAYRLESCEVTGREKNEDGTTAVTASAILANDSFKVEAKATLDFAKEGDGWALAGSDFSGTKARAIKGVDFLIGAADLVSLSGNPSEEVDNHEPLSDYADAEVSFDENAQTCAVEIPLTRDDGNWFVHPEGSTTAKYEFKDKRWVRADTSDAKEYGSDYAGQTFVDGPCSITFLDVNETTMQVEFAWSGEKSEHDPEGAPGGSGQLLDMVTAGTVPFEGTATYSGAYSLGDSTAVNKYSQESGEGFVLSRDAGYEDTDTPTELECRFTKDKSLSITWNFQYSMRQATFKLV